MILTPSPLYIHWYLRLLMFVSKMKVDNLETAKKVGKLFELLEDVWVEMYKEEPWKQYIHKYIITENCI